MKTSAGYTPLSTANRHDEMVLIALRRIIRAIDLHSRLLVQRHGVTGPQLVVLREIAACLDGIFAGQLADRVCLSKGTVTGILDRLEKRRLVTRRRGDDRRQVRINVTPAGKRLLKTAPSPLQEQFIEKFTALPTVEQDEIISCLQRVVAMMDAADIDAGALLATGPLPDNASSPENASSTQSPMASKKK